MVVLGAVNRFQLQNIERVERRLQPGRRDAQVLSCGLDVGMSWQHLNGAQICTCFQHVRSATMSKNVGRNRTVNACAQSGEVTRHPNGFALHWLIGPHLGGE